jgi:carboxyl-terminal processing protease
MSRWNLAWLLGINGVALLGLAISYSAPPAEDNKKYERMRLLVDTLDEVEKNFVHKLSDEQMRALVEDMINGGLARLDPYSSFINSKKVREFNKHSKGKFGGVGIQIHADRQSGLITVISPIPGTPAYDAGVQPGDLIYKIDGQSTENMTLEEAVDKITGEKGQPIVLTVVHKGGKEPIDLKMVRDVIEMESVLGDVRKKGNPREWEYMYDKRQKIAYIRLTAFNENSSGELHKVVKNLKSQGLRGLILDLRYNPGGLLTSAVEVSNLFLKEGSRIVSIRGRNQKERAYDALAERKRGDVLVPWSLLDSPEECPMAVLINRSSASASEIVAAALKDNKRAIIIGERSFGKGSVQNVIEMENHMSVLKLTTASYWRPNGKNIHRLDKNKDSDEWGVKPSEGPFTVRPEVLSLLGCAPGAGYPATPLWPALLLSTNKKIPSRYHIWLTEEERVQYQIYRYQRDIVQGKHQKGSGPKIEETDPDLAKFKDRVLESALNYLRGEFRKMKATPPRVPPIANT